MWALYLPWSSTDLGSVLQVVVAIRHPEAALEQVRRVAARIAEARRRPEPERTVGVEVGAVERIDVGAQAAAEHAGERRRLSLIAAIASSSAFRGERPRFSIACFVHVGVVVRADHRARLRPAEAPALPAFWISSHGPLLDHFLDERERGVDGAVGRDLGRLHPAAVGIVVEVVAGPDGGIHPGDVHGRDLGPRLGREPGAHRQGGDQDRQDGVFRLFSQDSPSFLRVTDSPGGPTAYTRRPRAMPASTVLGIFLAQPRRP